MKDFPAYGKGNTGRLQRSQERLPSVASFRFLAILALLLAVALFFVAQRIEFIRTERRIRDLFIQRRQITESILPIKLEVYNLSRMGRIEEIAKSRLSLHDPYPSQVIRPAPPVTEEEKKDEEASSEEQSLKGKPAQGEPTAPTDATPEIVAPEE